MTRNALLALLTLLLAACSEKASAPPEVRAARVVLPAPGMPMAAGYFELHNPGPDALRLVGVSSPAFKSVDMHETVEEQGLSRMRALPGVEVAAGGHVAFEPGGKHLMLMGAQLGDTAPTELPLRLELEAADGSRLTLEARFKLEAAGAENHGHHHH